MILIFSISDSLGGAEQVLFKIAKYYSEQDQKVNIFFFKPKTTEYWKKKLNHNVNIVYFNNSLLELIKNLNNKSFQSVFSSHLMMNALLGLLRNLGILKTEKFIVRESTQVFGRYKGIKLLRYKLAYWIGYKKIDLIISQTSLMKEVLDKEVPYLKKRTIIKVVPNPFDFPEELQMKENVDILQNTIVSAGRLIKEKGFDILIKSFSEIVKINPELNLMILGEGNERSILEKLISESGLQEKVILKGHVQNVYPYFKEAKMCVISSIREGFPNVLLQMMSQNTKVVSTLCAGDIENINGIVTCPPNNVKKLYEAKSYLLKSDTSLNRRIFDDELNKRSIESFVTTIEKNINENPQTPPHNNSPNLFKNTSQRTTPVYGFKWF